MTKEDKELLIKDISARLPYGVKSKNIWVKMGGEIEECIRRKRNDNKRNSKKNL